MVISIGARSSALLERLAKRNVPVLNTLTDGGIEIVIRRNGQWRIESMHGREVSTPLGELITP